MKRLTVLVEEYLRKYPALVSISSLKTALKLGYSYRTPYTNSKINSEVIYSVADIAGRSKLVPECAQLVYNDEGRLEEANSFESILVKETH